jgi:ABC-2 type transport system ATP-binding protein
MRRLLRDLADRGGTVLLSSHLLREIEAVADRLILISRGRLVAHGAKEELLVSAGTLVRGTNHAGLERALTEAGIGIARSNGALIADAEPREVGIAAQTAGVALTELRPADNGGLEQLFLSLTAAGQEEDDR